jgi:hypothetical protein
MFSTLLQAIIKEEMKPFGFYLHRLKPELLASEFSHLCIRQGETKKLPLLPQIIVKCKDVHAEKSKSRFQVLMGPPDVSGQHLSALNLASLIIIDDESPKLNSLIAKEFSR